MEPSLQTYLGSCEQNVEAKLYELSLKCRLRPSEGLRCVPLDIQQSVVVDGTHVIQSQSQHLQTEGRSNLATGLLSSAPSSQSAGIGSTVQSQYSSDTPNNTAKDTRSRGLPDKIEVITNIIERIRNALRSLTKPIVKLKKLDLVADPKALEDKLKSLAESSTDHYYTLLASYVYRYRLARSGAEEQTSSLTEPEIDMAVITSLIITDLFPHLSRYTFLICNAVAGEFHTGLIQNPSLTLLSMQHQIPCYERSAIPLARDCKRDS